MAAVEGATELASGKTYAFADEKGIQPLFVQKRIGRDGRPFRLYKFRTLVHDLDDSAHRAFMQAFVRGEVDHTSAAASMDVVKPFDCSQMTRIGAILRKTILCVVACKGTH
jgi:lipopolysaccharide/colanic/teichoic acid biosynthesis glycosyltransferase